MGQMKPLTYEELNRLWGLFFLFGLAAQDEGNNRMADFYEGERKGLVDKRVAMLTEIRRYRDSR